VAERGDPTAAVYARLFALHPELEALFIMGDNAKGHMLDEVLRVVLDHLGPRTYAAGFMRAEVVTHEQLGVPPDLFMRFFPIVRDAFREFAGEDWTPEMDAAWDELLAELQAVFG
jgi:hemoglobin-like flavoprotein